MTHTYGDFAPSWFQEIVRSVAHTLPEGYFGRRAASILLRAAGAKHARRPFDVSVFASERARLYPADNFCEKRVFLTPQFWEARERAALASAIANAQGNDYYFVDVGANAGLYTLFARSRVIARGLDFRALCVEPDLEMRRRLRYNLALTGAALDLQVSSFAASDSACVLRFAPNSASRGQSRVDENGSIEVEARPLLDLVREAGFPRIDAIKIDVEGHEAPILTAFFGTAPRALFPHLLLMETSHDTLDHAAHKIVAESGYLAMTTTPANTVYALS